MANEGESRRSRSTAHTGRAATYRIDEAAALLGVGVNAAYEAARRGDIPTIRIGGRILVPRAALNDLLGIQDSGRAIA